MTTTTALPPKRDSFEIALGASVVFHFVVFIFLAVRAVFAPVAELQAPPSIRVDVVDLPDHQAKLPPAPKPQPAEQPPKPPDVKTPPPAPEPPKAHVAPISDSPKVNLNKTKHDEAAALRRLEAISRLQNERPKPPPAQAPAAATPAPPAPIKGNEATEGSALKGITKLENESYTQTVQNHVTRHWNLPGFLSDANLSALVRVFVDGQGNLLKKVLVRSSNNPVFDQSAMTAVDTSLPLPHPPSDLVNLVSVRGIDIDFTPGH